MTDHINLLEGEALRLLLDGDDPTLAVLREQLSSVVDVRREYTGVGEFLNFRLAPDSPRLPGNASFAIVDVWCEVEGQELGASIVLFVEAGVISFLDIAAFGDSWPTSIESFTVHYQKAGGRDLESLRRTPGWPGEETRERGGNGDRSSFLTIE